VTKADLDARGYQFIDPIRLARLTQGKTVLSF